jgi:hypothetical protein
MTYDIGIPGPKVYFLHDTAIKAINKLLVKNIHGIN